MATHLGRLKIVTKRKDGYCRYKNCEVSDHKILAGEAALILTRLGKISGKPAIFYKSYHPKCFGPWTMWMCDQTPASKDGRKTMELEPLAKAERGKLVRERARILRALRTATASNLESKVARIEELDALIAATGYPIIRYKGRRSQSVVNFGKFVKEIKDRYKSEMRVPRSAWDQAASMGQSQEFRKEMEAWRKESQDKVQLQKEHYEDKQEDREKTNE